MVRVFGGMERNGKEWSYQGGSGYKNAGFGFTGGVMISCTTSEFCISFNQSNVADLQAQSQAPCDLNTDVNKLIIFDFVYLWLNFDGPYARGV